MKKLIPSKYLAVLVTFLFLFMQLAAPVSFANHIPVPGEGLVSETQFTAVEPAEDHDDDHDGDHEDQDVFGETALGFLMNDGLALSKPEDPVAGKPPSQGNLKLQQIKAAEITPTSAKITWSTTVAADSKVEYGTTASYGFSVTDASLVSKHSIPLTNLNPSTVYHYRVTSRDAGGNENVSTDFTFTTLTIDLAAPVISSVNSSNINNAGATITWLTDEPATTQIEYGTTTAYGSTTALNSNLVTNHSQSLSNLAANTTYHYRVLSRDASGNASVSNDFNFKTASSSGNPATIFLNFWGALVPQWGSYSNLNFAAYAGPVGAISTVLSALHEMFSVFNLNVTTTNPFVPTQTYANPTDEANAKYAYYTQNRIQEVVITDTNSAVYFGGNYGGIAYVDNFTSSIANTTFVFARNLSNVDRYIWVASAHETGHGFGLQHQSEYDASGNKINEYYAGSNGIAPIMGYGYDRRAQWWYGTSSISSTTYQDDLAVISRSANGFGFRADEAGNTPNSAAAFSDVFGTSFGSSGVITTSADRDYYEFTTVQNGTVSFNVSPADYGAMLNLALEIRDANDNLVTALDTASLEEGLLNYFLPAGKYYLVVKSHGLYGDIGQYRINGTVPAGTTTTAGPNAPAGSGGTGSGGSGGGGSTPAPLAQLGTEVSPLPHDYFDPFFPRSGRLPLQKTSLRRFKGITAKRGSASTRKTTVKPPAFSRFTRITEGALPEKQEQEVQELPSGDFFSALTHPEPQAIGDPLEFMKTQIREEQPPAHAAAVQGSSEALERNLPIRKDARLMKTMGVPGTLMLLVIRYLEGDAVIDGN